MTKLLKLASALLPAVVLAACGTGEPGGQQAPPPAVEVAEVLEETTTIWGDFTGRVAAPQTVELRPRVSGYIEEVAFTEGDLVLKGDLLFRIDPRPYRARVRAAEAQLARASSELELADSQAGRASQLLQSRAISREEHDRRKSAAASARAAVNAARAELENAKLDLEYTRVTAPISGRVSRAFITRGNLASADQSLLTTLVSVDPMYVYFEGNQEALDSNLALARPGNETPVRIALGHSGDFSLSGKLNFVDNRLNSNTGTVQFRAQVANPDGALRPGQFARVQMPVEQVRRAILVNRKAVMTDQDRRYVYVIGEDNTVARRDVELGPQQGELVLIRDGLKDREQVVINGLQKIFAPGMPVEPQLVAMRSQSAEQQVALH
ncbi:efflux RND transporter periplasmic adaptor subunit [Microbulbifer sp. YPW16]|uniref:efflux RND transporter periplasmic adaptor subunit n=1 Tax=Microbulbifer sp. YPW16 TaxID=2904242 RepID=UPI001E633453|nr:efflux RND transporter periplasmic adaptor subunit [Microbulbifer sp. YPW16]UHQ54701.1 efflux RND transporter periplasmic adaptor subunit [Microbulbifer sp. YPW16]